MFSEELNQLYELLDTTKDKQLRNAIWKEIQELEKKEVSIAAISNPKVAN